MNNRLQQLAGIISEVKVKTQKATDLQFILRDLANAYGEQIADDQITDEFKNYTVGQIKDDWIKLKSIKENSTNTPSDVAALSKAQQTSTSVTSKAKSINSINEFPGAFENWFKTLGFQPGKVSKSAVRSEVEKVLTKLGYK
jgi:hypothetical protein